MFFEVILKEQIELDRFQNSYSNALMMLFRKLRSMLKLESTIFYYKTRSHPNGF